ncbi:hypothetical protein [Patiriisocius sp. Uisw_017]|uniref:hypothetical protein n=1 Tax=Patiriisocius sp. Uisw_017 TaxID=3230968 RepID=UPI0039E970BA
MNIRPHIQFYKEIFPFVAAFGSVGTIAFGILYGFVFFLTFGLGFGFFAFNTFKKAQWYAYQNLGITRWQLLKSSFLMNVLLGLPVYIFLFILISFILGDFSLT